jgi:Fic family protein
MSSDRAAASPPGGHAPWPPVSWEELAWVPRIRPDQVSATLRKRHAGPYRSAVAPGIAELPLPLPADVLALSEEAAVEVARFDAELGSEVAPFASVLLRSESTSSSKIENLTSGAKAIALAELGSREKRNATEIVGNVAAMRAALELADRLDGPAILAMHAALMGGHEAEIAGRWREEQVWIGGDSYGPHGAMFVPPRYEHVPALVEDLVVFTRRTDLPLLAQAAVAHAQFETIHPFVDGNGRTGRALIHALLRGHGLTRNVTVPVSAGLLTNTGGYFEALTAYRAGDIGPIIERLAEASFAATANGRVLVNELRRIRASWDGEIAARRDSAAWRLADLLLRQPVVDAVTVATELEISPQNVQRAIAPLVEGGVLTEFTGFRRNRMWQSREVLRELDAFAARAGRRAGRPEGA